MTGRPHVFTVDVEEWFQVSAFEPHVDRAQWPRLASRVEAQMERLLELLAEREQRGTFFVLAWLAERRPQLLRRIVDSGHEVASHGWWHRRVTMQTPDEFREDVKRARLVLEDIAGAPVYGYRAPSFSIVPGREYAFDALLEAGYRYDSSIFPIRRSRGYGYPGAPDEPYAIQRAAGTLLELPITPLHIAGARIPASGGAYFRHLPYAFTRAMLRQRQRQGLSGVFYLHPWEIDPAQPRMQVSLITRLRHYGGVSRTEPLLKRLLGEFRFTSASDALGIHPTVPAGATHTRSGQA